MVSLEKLMGTKYIIDSLESELYKVLQETKETIDIGDCKLGPKAESAIRRNYKTVDFCNTKNMRLDALLKRNIEASRRTETDQRETLREEFLSNTDIYEYLLSLKEGVIYTTNRSSDLTVYTAILVLLCRPDVTVDMGSSIVKMFELVRANWDISSKHEAYWQRDGLSMRKLVVDDRGRVTDLYDNTVSVYALLKSSSDIIPYDIGNRKLNREEEFAPLITKVISVLSKRAEKPKRMVDYM